MILQTAFFHFRKSKLWARHRTGNEKHIAQYSHQSNRRQFTLSLFLLQSINIMELTLQKYGSYEKFEQATGGSLLSKTRIWSHVRKYMMKEGCMGEV